MYEVIRAAAGRGVGTPRRLSPRSGHANVRRRCKVEGAVVPLSPGVEPEGHFIMPHRRNRCKYAPSLDGLEPRLSLSPVAGGDPKPPPAWVARAPVNPGPAGRPCGTGSGIVIVTRPGGAWIS